MVDLIIGPESDGLKATALLRELPAEPFWARLYPDL